MRKRKIRLLGLVMILGVSFLGLLATNLPAAEVQVEMVTVQKMRAVQEVEKTADNFIVLFDASGSMQKPYENTNMKKADVANTIFRQRNEALPNLDWNSGLYLYTPWRTFYDMKPYNKEEYGNSLDKLATEKPSISYVNQPTPLPQAIRNLDPILARLSGQTAVFIFSDGLYTPSRPRIHPAGAAKELNSKYDVCFYIYSSADTPRRRKVVQDIASVNPCSRVIPFDAVLNRPEYTTGALYVVKDIAIVESEMISKVVGIDLDSILFDFDKTDIRSEYHDELNALGKFLLEHPKAYVVIEGFTDSAGDVAYNMYLSRERAENVRDYLMDNFNIDESRLVVVWYGKAVPVASEDTAGGRAQNRRVRLLVEGLK